jgi:UDP-N-acetylmuramate--alanine ligase
MSLVHFIGIGGIGMSALAEIARARGAEVSGSDLESSPLIARLRRLGARVQVGEHKAENVGEASLVVVSDAIRPDNPELGAARARGIPVVRRSRYMAKLMEGRRGLAVAGTHGKTTTTAMIAAILVEAGADPTMVLGGEYAPLGGNARVGEGEWMVVEACEAFNSHLDLSPEIAVVTNIEAEHLDYHKSEQALRESFGGFLERIRPGGCAVLCFDCEAVKEIAPRFGGRKLSYGLSEGCDYRASETRSGEEGSSFVLLHRGQALGSFELRLAGNHNIANAAGAIAAGCAAGFGVEAARGALEKFTGVSRRFEVLGAARGIIVVDDYAHHPTEIRATLEAARARFPGRRLVAAFQPHLYSRTEAFAPEFARALAGADVILVTEIYAAREEPIPGVSGEQIVEAARALGRKDADFFAAKEALREELLGRLRPGDVLLTLGAGDVYTVARDVLASLRS